MQPATIKKLIDLNHLFYQTLAVQFSQTRGRIQPGVRRILDGVLDELPTEAGILDLGCGNGELARALRQAGCRGRYVGLDFSAEMLAEARRRVRGAGPGAPQAPPVIPAGVPQGFPAGSLACTFLPADLADPGWAAAMQAGPGLPPSYDLVLAFAVLHHLPGADLRRLVLGDVHRLLAPGGRFAHSNWQFLHSPRLRGRLQPWETIGLSPEDVDPGDYLLDWKSGGYGLRYAHHFSEAELAALAAETSFQVEEIFHSDGEGGKLGLYGVWKKA